MKKIVKLVIKDYDIVGTSEYPDGILDTYYLVNPDSNKLAELDNMISRRFDYQYADNITDEEIVQAELFCDNIWGEIDKFITNNFITLDIYQTYTISY